jgi:Domain of unknown function (DUF4167)
MKTQNTDKWSRGGDRFSSSLCDGTNLSPTKANTTQAKHKYERYLARVNATFVTGDVVQAENYFQHAEHYFRVMREPAA